MARTQVGTQQILDGGIGRADLNTTTSGSAVIAKVTAGTGITLDSTGADAGTGDVTVGLAASGVTAGSYPKVTVDTTGRVTSGSALAAGDIVAGSNNYVQNQSTEAQIGNAWLSGWHAGSSFRAYNGTNYSELRAPNTLSANISFALPNAYSATGYTLTDDGAGNLSWTAITSNVLTGLGAGSNTAIAATDSILTAFAKLQAQITAGGGGGGGGSNTAGHCSTMTRASAKDVIGLTTTNTSVYFTDLVPDAGFTITTASTFEAEITQTSAGSLKFILTDVSYKVIAYSATVVNPVTGLVTAVLSTFASGSTYDLVAGVRYNLGVMSNQNSPLFLGLAATQYTNIAPYPSIRFDNVGSMTPPASFSGGSESLMRVYARLKV